MAHAEVAPKPVNTEFIGRTLTSLSVLNATKGALWGGLFGVSQSFASAYKEVSLDARTKKLAIDVDGFKNLWRSRMALSVPSAVGHTVLFAVLRGNTVTEGDLHGPAVLPFLATLAPTAAWVAVKRAAPPTALIYGPVAAATLHLYDRWWTTALPAGVMPTTGLRRRTL